MVLDGIIVESTEHLEALIVDLPDESKIALRLLWANLSQ